MQAAGLLLVVGAVLVGAPTAATAQTIYKCTRGGTTAYQDAPCTGAGIKSHKMSLEPASVTPPSAHTAAATTTAKPALDTATQQTLRSITSQQRVLNAQIRAEGAFMQAEMDAARRRAQRQSPDAQTRAMMQGHDKWWPGIQAKEAQAKWLTDAVRRLCPGGAMVDTKHAVCLQD